MECAGNIGIFECWGCQSPWRGDIILKNADTNYKRASSVAPGADPGWERSGNERLGCVGVSSKEG